MINSDTQELVALLERLDSFTLLTSTDIKTYTAKTPHGDEVTVSYQVNTNINGMFGDDAVFQAILTVGANKRTFVHFGATCQATNALIVRYVRKQVRICEDYVRTLDSNISERVNTLLG